MELVHSLHSIFGERVLPVLIVFAAIYLTVTYKTGGPPNPVARFFPVLIDLQAGLGVIYWLFLILSTSGELQARFIGFPFILHPITGLLAAGLAHMLVSGKTPIRNLGRWAPLASLGILLVMVLGNVMLGRMDG